MSTPAPTPPPIEEPFALLNYDMVRVSPYELLIRLQAISNATVEEHRKQRDNKSEMIGMSKKDIRYDNFNRERYEIDAKLDALKSKYNVLQQVLYIKSAEMRMVTRDMPGRTGVI